MSIAVEIIDRASDLRNAGINDKARPEGRRRKAESKWHPFAEMFPLMPDDEIDALAKDIKENGLREAIVIDEAGRIIDGRNRERACRKAGIEPTYWPVGHFLPVVNDDTVLRFVVTKNLYRRHLTAGQRATIADELSDQKAAASASSQRMSQRAAAKALNVSTRSVSDAAKVRKKGTPELFAAVKRGDLPVSAAAELVDQPTEVQNALASEPAKAKKVAAAKRNATKLKKCGCPRSERVCRHVGVPKDQRPQAEKDQDLPPEYHEAAAKIADVLVGLPEGCWTEVCDLAYGKARAVVKMSERPS